MHLTALCEAGPFSFWKSVPRILKTKTFLVMKLTAVFLLFACLQVSATGHAQKVSVSGQNLSLQKIFQKIQRQTAYSFFYTDSDLSKAKKVTISVSNANLMDVLDLVFRDQPLNYSIVSTTIVVKALKRVENVVATLPDIDVRGRVINEKGEPVVVTVAIRGTNRATSTNEQGEFELFGVDENATLVFSGIGIEEEAVKLAGRKVLNITLNTRVTQSDEIVVVAYGTQKRSSFTGSAATVNPEAYEGSTRASVQENLQGNVAGVIATNGSGQPGAAPSIRIRGVGSINAGSTPLYVVDGIPLEATSVNSLNASDIESFTVLKDAAAASIYGSRAANGVILITTKKGKSGKTKFNLSTQMGFNRVTLDKELVPLNTKEMITLLREGARNAGITEEKFLADLKGADVDTTVDTDWFDVLTRNGQYQQYDLSASGGTDKTTFYASGGYYSSKAALEGSDFKRYNGSFKIQNQATDKLSFNLGLQLNYRKMNEQPDDGSNGNPVRMYKRYQPWLRVFNDDGTYDLSYLNKYNPLAVVRENWNTTSNFGTLGNVRVKYAFSPSVSVENQANFDFNYNDQKLFYKGGIGTARSNGGEAYYSTYRRLNWVNTSILRFNKNFNDQGINAYVGYEAQKVTGSGNNAGVENFLPGTFTLDNAAIATEAGSNETSNTLNSVFANANYNFQSRFYLSASVRRDGSSRFGAEKRFGNFWSVGVSWNMLQEKFLQSIGALSELRLRASYGVNGNQDIGDFVSRALYSAEDYNQSPGYVFSRYGNNMLTWEKNKPFNVGLDFGLLSNRVSGTVEYYTRKTSDLLLDMPVSATNGATSLFSNVGEMRNSGWEFLVNTRNIVSRNNGFEWGTSFNISTLKNEITALTSPIIGDSYNRYLGGDFYQLYVKGYAGVDPQTGEALWYTDATQAKTTNDYGKAIQYNQGSALPKFFGGLTNTFDYKGLSLRFLIYFNYGNKIYDNWGGNSNSDGSAGFNGSASMPRYTYNNRWQKPGDITDAPKIVYKGTQSGSSSYSSTRFLYSGDYIRLRDVSLSYNLPQNIINAARFSGATVYVRASNLFTYIKDKRINFDPEVGIEGKADQNAPMYKTVVFGLQFNF